MAGFTGSHNPLLSNYFDFTLARIPNMVYFCQAANIPGLNFGTGEQPTIFGYPVKVPMGTFRFENLELTFKVDENMTNWLEIWNWMKSNGNFGSSVTSSSDGSSGVPCSTAYSDKVSSDAVLTLTNSAYSPKISISFKNLFPVSLSGLQFTTALQESAEVLATATFTFTNYDIQVVENA